MTEPTALRGNCAIDQLTLTPLGAILVPTTRTPADRPLWFADNDDRIIIRRNGTAVIPAESGEKQLARWSFVSPGRPEFEIQATWITRSGRICQGLKVQAIDADLVLTDQAVRIGLATSSPKLPGGGGPWVRFNDNDRMSNIRNDCVYGALFPLTDIEEIMGSRNGLGIAHAGGSIRLQGSIRQYDSNIDGKTLLIKCNHGELATTVMDAILNAFEDSDDPAKLDVADRYSEVDYEAAFSKRAPTIFQFNEPNQS